MHVCWAELYRKAFMKGPTKKQSPKKLVLTRVSKVIGTCAETSTPGRRTEGVHLNFPLSPLSFFYIFPLIFSLDPFSSNPVLLPFTFSATSPRPSWISCPEQLLLAPSPSLRRPEQHHLPSTLRRGGSKAAARARLSLAAAARAPPAAMPSLFPRLGP